MKHIIYSQEYIDGLELMINEDYNGMKKSVETSYPNKDIKALKLSEIKYLPNLKLIIKRTRNKGKYNKAIRVDSFFVGWSWYLKVSKCKSDIRYYNYFNKILEEAGIKEN